MNSTDDDRPLAVGSSEGLGAGAGARETCPACGDHAAHKVQRLECNSCGCALVSEWERAPSSPIDVLLAEYAAECSDFSGQGGYEFALKLARRYAERGPDSQMRCVVHTLLARLEAPNVR
jgi:hypothetical protein